MIHVHATFVVTSISLFCSVCIGVQLCNYCELLMVAPGIHNMPSTKQTFCFFFLVISYLLFYYYFISLFYTGPMLIAVFITEMGVLHKYVYY